MELTSLERAVADAAQHRDNGLVDVPQTRRSHGVVHTPAKLARSVVRMAERALRSQGMSGLADPRVTVIDPACGPGAFVAAARAVAGSGLSLRGFDLDPHALELLRAALEKCGELQHADLTRVDTLRSAPLLDEVSGLQCPCIVGNPPWATAAAAPLGAPMEDLLAEYRRDAEGRELGERKVGALRDLYVAFLRWSSELALRATGPAVVALITNNSYLEGPVHRGMRASLLRSFDAIDILDLGGNAMLGRVSGGARDDNVFGVRTGVAVTVAVRFAERADAACRVRYARVRGTVEEKLCALEGWDERAFDPKPLAVAAPLHRFVPTARVDARYQAWPSLGEVVPFHREGVQSNRDAAVVATDAATLLCRLHRFVDGAPAPELDAARRRLAHYDPERARAAVARALERDPVGRLGLSLRPLAYRPFDTRVFCPVVPLCHRPRPQLAEAMAASAFALVTVRKDRGEIPWRHVGLVHCEVDSSFLSARSSCRTRAFPTRAPSGGDNLDAAFAAQMSERVGRPVDAEQVLLYCAAVFASPGYRGAYDDALRQDYPRIPWPRDPETFERWLAAGRRLEAAPRQRGLEPSLEPGAPGASAANVGGAVEVGHLRVDAVLDRRAVSSASPLDAADYRRAALARAAAWQQALQALPDFTP